jgi:hypothetical protein
VARSSTGEGGGEAHFTSTRCLSTDHSTPSQLLALCSTGCLLAHALGVPAIDVSGNAFFDAPLTTPQVQMQHSVN